MRAKDELTLVRIANWFIGQMGIVGDGFGSFNPKTFFEHVEVTRGRILIHYLNEMSNEKLGFIVGLGQYAGYEKSDYRKTELPHLSSMSLRNGHDQLVELARPVILATMYDIFATQYVLIEKEALQWRDTWDRSPPNRTGYWPKHEMRNFVVENRLRKKVS